MSLQTLIVFTVIFIAMFFVGFIVAKLQLERKLDRCIKDLGKLPDEDFRYICDGVWWALTYIISNKKGK